MIRSLKSLIPERVKGPLMAEFRPAPVADLSAWRDRKKVVVALAGFYQNLGDLALTYSQKLFIESVLPDYEVLLFASTDTYKRMKALKSVVGPQDIITTIGGGNMDDVYPSLENARRYVIRSFPRNPIISFPQTMAFTESAEGRRALARTVRTYGSHPNLTVFAREPESYSRMKEALHDVRVELAPDTVLSLPDQGRLQDRSGFLLSMRSDKETLVTAKDRDRITAAMHAISGDILLRDTVEVAPEQCRQETYESTLKEHWNLLSSRRVAVTDRLHGMIFSAITRTPCVVLSNSNHKIRGTYDAWLRDCPFVRFLDPFDPATLSASLKEFWHLESTQIVRPDLIAAYDPLRRALLAAAKR